MNAFEHRIQQDCLLDMNNLDLNIFQINVGFRCNLQCSHCHLECGPDRQEMMAWETMEHVIETAALLQPDKIDITGGAPEFHPHLRRFISKIKNSGREIQTRTNLTVLLEPEMEGLSVFFKDNQVRLVASLPCYLEDEGCAQRGKGTYRKSITVLRELNNLGYGMEPGLGLDLIYNPAGPFLPPDQYRLEEDYKHELRERFGIQFSRLLTITNMPIGRFWKHLKQQDKHGEYMQLLTSGFNCSTVPDLMCRHQICVAWDGKLYDCDFNLALGLSLAPGLPQRIRDFNAAVMAGRRIQTGDHCFGCTAGLGSSCGGALLSE